MGAAPTTTGVAGFPVATGVADFGVDAGKRASPLQEEARDVANAKALLAQGRAQEALSLLGTSSARFSRGSLGQERDVVTIEALAGAGQHDAARERARAFIAAFPTSPFGGRVRPYAAADTR